MRKIAEKIWGAKTPAELLAKRFRLFVLICMVLIVVSKLLYLQGILPANVELIIPALVVVGSFSLHCGPTEFWRKVTRYFGLVAVASVALVDLALWGVHSIYAFTWSGFVFCWLLGMRNKLSMFDRFRRLVFSTTLTGAVAILAFDFWTGLIGWPLVTGTPWMTAFIGQIPFTFYHLCSLVFIPPLVGIGKILVRVKVPVPVAVGAGVKVKGLVRR